MTLPMFILLFALIYVPTAITLGVWHRKHQYSVENEALLRQNWMWAWISQYQIRLIKGKTSPKEDEYIINYLNEILVRTNKKDLIGQGDDIPELPKEKKPEDDK